jgi:hypothetical protein
MSLITLTGFADCSSHFLWVRKFYLDDYQSAAINCSLYLLTDLFLHYITTIFWLLRSYGVEVHRRTHAQQKGVSNAIDAPISSIGMKQGWRTLLKMSDWNTGYLEEDLVSCFTDDLYWSSSTRCSYQKDRREKPGNLPKRNAFSDIWKDWIAIYFYLGACRIVIVGGGGAFLCRKPSVGLAKILVVCISGALYQGEAVMLWS